MPDPNIDNKPNWKDTTPVRLKQIVGYFGDSLSEPEQLYALSSLCALEGLVGPTGEENAKIATAIRESVSPDDRMSLQATARLEGIQMACARMHRFAGLQDMNRLPNYEAGMRSIAPKLVESETRLYEFVHTAIQTGKGNTQLLNGPVE